MRAAMLAAQNFWLAASSPTLSGCCLKRKEGHTCQLQFCFRVHASSVAAVSMHAAHRCNPLLWGGACCLLLFVLLHLTDVVCRRAGVEGRGRGKVGQEHTFRGRAVQKPRISQWSAGGTQQCGAHAMLQSPAPAPPVVSCFTAILRMRYDLHVARAGRKSAALQTARHLYGAKTHLARCRHPSKCRPGCAPTHHPTPTHSPVDVKAVEEDKEGVQDGVVRLDRCGHTQLLCACLQFVGRRIGCA